jgi:signal transduction histidine kinase
MSSQDMSAGAPTGAVRPRPTAVRATAAVGTLLLLVSLLLQAVSWLESGSPADNWDLVVTGCGFLATGMLLHAVRPANPLVWLLLGTGAAAAVGAIASAEPNFGAVGDRVENVVWWLAYGPMAVVLLLLPDGRLPSPRWRAALVLAWAGVLLPTIGALLVTVALPMAINDPAARHGPVFGVAAMLNGTGYLLSTAMVVAGTVALAVRARRRPVESVGALRLLLLVGLALVLGLVLEVLNVPGSWLLGVVALPLVMLVAALRHRLLDLDLVIDRSVVWLGAGGALLACYAAVLWAVSAATGVHAPVEVVGSVVAATVVTAALVGPVFTWVQRALRRALYGRRDDPAAAMDIVDRNLGSTSPDLVVRSAAEALAAALALPFVALEVVGENRAVWTATHGRPAGEVVELALRRQNHRMGAVRVTARSRREQLTAAERRIVGVLARSAATTVRAVELAATVRQAREQLVFAREEERLRLRRDLHDGLGPALLGSRMEVVALARAAPGAAQRNAIERLSVGLAGCVDEVARVVDGLRPPALDEGLGAALQELANRFADHGPAVELDTSDPGALPAAVEVGVYRIASEALANAVRHAGARTCRLSLHRDADGVSLSVVDDGAGLHGPQASGATGVGLGSMRGRAEELGGTCTVTNGESGGTRVELWLPAAAPETAGICSGGLISPTVAP